MCTTSVYTNDLALGGSRLLAAKTARGRSVSGVAPRMTSRTTK